MKIDKLMSTSVFSCGAEDDLSVAAKIMWENDVGCVPVVDSQKRVIGMITDRDACMAAFTQGRRLDEIRVGLVMSKNVQVCGATDDVRVAEEIMQREQMHRLPVVDADKRLVGLLSLNDLAREAADERFLLDKGLGLDEVALTLARISAHRQHAAEDLVAQPPAVRPNVAPCMVSK
jgi:CBS-domain-containing membrane protein